MSQRSRTVLIVDDSPENRELYRRYLLRKPEYSHTNFRGSVWQLNRETKPVFKHHRTVWGTLNDID
ncbi:MAG: response regulator [Nostoc sp. ChiQUE01b]|nr:response regulator [Nostoc sp. ChiQUE01b]MDZ8259124.1 response regulator [Nostoc sp. ChiQUE01b]